MNGFPAGFLWGAATASYQVEGAVADDGRGPSCWDVFVRKPGAISSGDTGDVACDSYHRLEDDLALVEQLGLTSYRFSVSWPRVLPEGNGAVNQVGLDYYRRLVDGLSARGVAPALTLFHWDLPQALQERGGWAYRDCASWFADYAAVVAAALGDRVRLWVTLNEPAVVASRGYRDGTHAPGLTDPGAAAAATHHLLLGHGRAVAALRAQLGSAGTVGLVLDPAYVVALDEEDQDVAKTIAAEKTELFLGPVLDGRYPELAKPEFVPQAQVVRAGDLGEISTPIDFLGVNYYDPLFVRWRRGELSEGEADLAGYDGVVSVKPEGYARTTMGWVVDPASFYGLLVQLGTRAPGLPIYVTENGIALHDAVDRDGEVRDAARVEYLRLHILALKRALNHGVDVRGYYVWSLLDNFEWTHGYSQRFGLAYVDYATQRRLLKQSGNFYRQVIATNGAVLQEEPAR